MFLEDFMRLKNFSISMMLAMAILVLSAATTTVYAQGRGGGNGGGRPATAGPPMGSPGVDRGLGNASSRSSGRSDAGLGNASSRSNGRSDAGIDRARLARDNANRMSDSELNRYRGLSKRLGTTPAEMRARYQSALLANPDLTFGNFVAANVIADNLQSRFPAMTSSAILGGLANGDSIGETLHNLGLSKDQARDAKRNAEDQIKEAKNRNE